jgi:calcineurin-like phosphoesterase family protein
MARPAFTWITTDWHIGHRRMEEACGRPPDFEQRILDRHRALLMPQDTLVNLGDLIFYSKWKAWLRDALLALPCRHVLVLGNHDKNSVKSYYDLGFDLVCEGLIVDGVLLTHRPTLPPHGMVNVHGHWHNLGDRANESPDYDPFRQYLLSIEETDYRPVKLQEFVAGKKAKIEKGIAKAFRPTEETANG